MKVLSLFDGISCGMVALERAGIIVDEYFASEIEPNAIKISKKNYPSIIQLGDITKITEKMLDEIMPIDMVIGGSPCQDLSVYKFDRGEVNGLNGEKSGLFYHYVRILKYVKPKYFLLENVPMEERWKNQISELLGVEPILINSNLVCAADRKRLYWTNIPGIEQPADKGIILNDIVVPAEEIPEKYWYSKPFTYNGDDCKVQCTLEMNGHRHMKEVYNLKGKCSTLTTCAGGNLQKKVYQNGKCRKLIPLEYERLQTLPDGYTEGVADSHRYNTTGNGWTVDIIAHICSFLPDEYKKEKEYKTMELQIYNPTNDGFVKNIEWNHEEIKKELSEKVEYYNNLVYTEEQIKDAKADRAELNKFVTALEDKRKEIKKLCLAPYEDFEKKMKELVAIVNEPIKLIDSQVKGYEEQKKQEKLEEIKVYFSECEKPDWLSFEQIYDAKWLNATVSIKSVKEAIGIALNKIESDSVTLQMLPVFGFEAMEVYKTTLDVNKSISEANRMAEVARKRAEYEAEQTKKAEEVCQSVVEEKAEEIMAETEEDFIPDFSQPTKKWYEFKALLSPEDAQALAALFATRNIEYHQI